MKWTKEQEQVIVLRDRNLLVSAAAGSGKTAVLVERIIQMITDKTHPIDIDQLLVMTFTNAAAAEMRERISIAIEKQLEQHPEDEHLQVQSSLVHHAKITTIDSFCLSLIRDHFNLLEIDPDFRIGDEGELILIRADVMEQMLEAHYEAGDADFEQFIDTYAQGKADGGISDYIMQVYTFAMSNPWPALWLSQCRQEFEELEQKGLDGTAWMTFLLWDVKRQFKELSEQMEEAARICTEEDGPQAYLPTMQAYLTMLESLGEADTYEELSHRLQKVSFGRLAAARGEIDPEKKAWVTGCRDRVKKTIEGLQELYAFEPAEEALADMKGTKTAVLTLLDLTLEFTERYREKKRDKNLVDFNDLEHYALEILVKRENGAVQYTEAADELSHSYYEILVDEYQDSNYVQETLINSLSGERFGRPNVFMVGDVKQSIYKFRLAKPELFLEKHETYTTEDSLYQKIELHRNFRSRASVLESINDVFYGIMTRNLGNIHYTEDIALHPGMEFEATEGTAGTPTELLMVNTGREISQAEDEEYTAREMEAKMIAGKIRELTHPEQGLLVWDKEKKEYRTARYGDMVILLRSISGWTDSFLNILTQEGIPAYAETGTGYFNTIEIETVLSMLAVIDNPLQDIPLAAVMKSPMVGVSDEELAMMMAAYQKNPEKGQDRGLPGAWRYYLKLEEARPELCQKLKHFETILETMREEAAYLPIHELIYRVFVETGYYEYVSAMPAGETRRANLDMLVEKASAYEQTSYKGLFDFIRYIVELKEYNTDFGEASPGGSHDNMVRMMSIHKSKGLEFPIVFLAGLGKKFNKQDERGKILIDAELGIGTDYLDTDLRVKTPTLKKNVLKRKLELDSLGEELRVLYVAMTRAKEKLIMTATDRYLDKKLERWQQVPLTEGRIPYTVLTGASSYLDWILMSLSREKRNIQVQEILAEDLVGEEVVRQMKKKVSREQLEALELYGKGDEAYRERLIQALNFRYPYETDITLCAKMTVSQLKRQNSTEEGETEPALIPDFLKERKTDQGGGKEDKAYRGSAYHRALELLDFTCIQAVEDVAKQLEGFGKTGSMTGEGLKLVQANVLWEFVRSPLGQRMKRAQKEGRCHRERQFVMGIPAVKMGLGESEELVLVQGIIDAYLEEEDTLILIDYKTDRAVPGEEQVLFSRYEKQLDYYQAALEQMTGKKVSEKILYSITLQKEIKG